MIRKFGELDGRDVMRATLEDGDVSVSILNYGCITQDWRVPLGDRLQPCVLGFETFEDYPEHSRSFGIIAGRVANRTALGRFTLDGRAYQLPINNGPNHLHGGLLGLGRRLWSMEMDGRKSVQLSYRSPDGEEGYPASVDFTTTITLEGNALRYELSGVPDRVTPINLAQHAYYNLGGKDVLSHKIWMEADRYTPVDDTLIPTGAVASVSGHHFDFQKEVMIGEADPKRLGIDLNLVLKEGRDVKAPATIVTNQNGLQLTLWTDQPGIQVFDAPEMEIAVPGLDGQNYGPFSGLCLEAQKFPDALNHAQFPSILCSPNTPYHQDLVVEIK